VQPTPASAMLAKYGLAPSKRRGQNFLADGNVARKVVDAVGAGPGDVVVEIGSGFGAITFGLTEKAGHVVAVEIDSGIARAFEAEYGRPSGITLVTGDILEFDLAGVAGERGVEKVIVAGNLPYAVTSPVVRLLLEEKNVVSRAVLMVQAEVGARMVATPGERDYSALSVVLQFHARVRQLFGVRRTCFYPRPKVDSRVVEVGFEEPLERRSDPAAFSEVVHAAFGQRRKMLRRSLGALIDGAGILAGDLEAATGIDLSRRGESLSVEEFDELTTALRNDDGPGGPA
jgi:16S rRNA (adenine1518-N6/adenine1519-N6)-dimethyltransferase